MVGRVKTTNCSRVSCKDRMPTICWCAIMSYHFHIATHWLVVWLPFFIFPYIGLLIIPTDFHIFQRGGEKPPTSTVTHPLLGSTPDGHRCREMVLVAVAEDSRGRAQQQGPGNTQEILGPAPIRCNSKGNFNGMKGIFFSGGIGFI